MTLQRRKMPDRQRNKNENTFHYYLYGLMVYVYGSKVADRQRN